TFFAFTHLLSSFRRQQLKLPGGYCLKSWIHYIQTIRQLWTKQRRPD
ncbi:hypothetical protein AAKU67_004187, partial [Oxalobacteraceae bacterium GrIS 2.11]